MLSAPFSLAEENENRIQKEKWVVLILLQLWGVENLPALPQM